MVQAHAGWQDRVNCVAALSGGTDSALLLATMPIDRAVFVDYGQPAARQERRAAHGLANRFDVPFIEVTVRGLELGAMGDGEGVAGPRVVQARNAMLAAVVANHCSQGYIYFGAHKDDLAEYADCRGDFFAYLTAAFSAAYGVAVCAPFLAMTKGEILGELQKYMIELNTCWSCYTPTDRGKPCGSCNSCRARL